MSRGVRDEGMAEETKIHRATTGILSLQIFYIQQGKVRFVFYHDTVGWEGHHWILRRPGKVWYPSNPSSPLEVLVVSGHGIEKILREGRLMTDGDEGRWMI